MATKYNPFTKKLDLVEVSDVGFPSSTAIDNLEVIDDGSGNGVIYFWANGHRFKLNGTLDDPAGGGTGSPIGLLLALTYP